MNQLKLLRKRVKTLWDMEARLPPQEREFHSWQVACQQGGVTYVVGKGGANTFYARINDNEPKYLMPDDCFALIDKWIGRKYAMYGISKSKRMEKALVTSVSLKKLKSSTDDKYLDYFIVGYDSQGDAERLYKLQGGLQSNEWTPFRRKSAR